jgi:hypothetical protein
MYQHVHIRATGCETPSKVGKANGRSVVSDVGAVESSHLIASRLDSINYLLPGNFFARARSFQLAQNRLLLRAARTYARHRFRLYQGSRQQEQRQHRNKDYHSDRHTDSFWFTHN